MSRTVLTLAQAHEAAERASERYVKARPGSAEETDAKRAKARAWALVERIQKADAEAYRVNRIAELEVSLEDVRESRSRAHDRADAATSKVLQLQAHLGRAEAVLRRIAEGQEMVGPGKRPYTHLDTVIEYQRIAREAL